MYKRVIRYDDIIGTLSVSSVQSPLASPMTVQFSPQIESTSKTPIPIFYFETKLKKIGNKKQ